jgi:hypothetical protein
MVIVILRDSPGNKLVKLYVNPLAVGMEPDGDTEIGFALLALVKVTVPEVMV